MPESRDNALILVIDDAETHRYAKARILRRAGFEVIEGSNGADAFRLVAERTPRLVLLDVKLPDVSGWDVCRRIKQNPETASVLVLQMSATFVTGDDTVRALEGGADGCLTEPVDPAVLVATVRSLLRARQAEDALRQALVREQELRVAAEDANHAKDDFLAMLSHELRSPLSAILTWASLLRAGRLDQTRTDRAVEAIERNSRLQVRMIEDLLDVSRIITGKMNIEFALVDLAAVVEAALDSVRPAASAKGVRIESTVDPAVGPVSGDAARLQQILWNLLSNAIKFTPKGGHVELRVKEVDSQAEICVSDSGIGIEAPMLPHVFERFRQADSSTTRSEGGLGLGLALVRHFVELHRGTVEAKSDGLGRGSTFVVRLPLPAVRLGSGRIEAVEALRARLPSDTLPDLAGIRALVVDDEPDAREAIAYVLEQCGASARTVASAAAALEALSGADFHVMISDIAMPEQDGLVLIQRLRELGNRTPALALTAYAGSGDAQRMIAAGYQGYLAKPVAAADLGAAVARVLGSP